MPCLTPPPSYASVTYLFYRRSRAYSASGQGHVLADVQRRVALTSLFVLAAVVLRTFYQTLHLMAHGGYEQVLRCGWGGVEEFKMSFCAADPCDRWWWW